MTQAFVAGATGYTGRALVEELTRQGLATQAHIRPGSPRLEEWRQRFQALGASVDSSPWEAVAFQEALRACQPSLVFATLGTTAHRARAEGMRPQEAYRRIDRDLTLLIVRALQAAGLRPRFVYLSSLGVRPGVRLPYLRARLDVEEALAESGLPYTIVRPAIITGPGREEPRRLEGLGAALGDRLLGAAGLLGATRLQKRYRSMTGPELAKAMVRAALDPRAENQVLEGEALRGG